MSRLFPRIPHAAMFMLFAAWAAGVATMIFAWTIDSSSAPADTEPTAVPTPTHQAPTQGPRAGGDDATLQVPEVHNQEDVGEGAVAAAAAADSSVKPAENDLPPFTMPLRPYAHWTDRFGAARGNGFIHGGIDLSVEGLEGSKVYSACPGAVSATDYSYSYGNYVVVDCGNAWATLYAHLSKINVEVGQAATAATVLGITGSTGYSTGEHLHFEIIHDGTRVNPEDYLDFHIPPGTPLSNGPLIFPGRGSGGSAPTYVPPTPTPTATPTPTDTPIPTATLPPTQAPSPTPITPTPKPTSTPTNTPLPPTPTSTPTQPPISVP